MASYTHTSVASVFFLAFCIFLLLFLSVPGDSVQECGIQDLEAYFMQSFGFPLSDVLQIETLQAQLAQQELAWAQQVCWC